MHRRRFRAADGNRSEGREQRKNLYGPHDAPLPILPLPRWERGRGEGEKPFPSSFCRQATARPWQGYARRGPLPCQGGSALGPA